MRTPVQCIEVERIYSQMLSEQRRCVAITACNSEEGVTCVAMALAQHSLLAGDSTLLVDLNLYHPTLKGLLKHDVPESQHALLASPQIVGNPEENIALPGIVAPSSRQALVKLRKPGVLEQLVSRWRQEFDTIIFDTSPLNRVNANNIPPERVAAACDGCLLTVLSGHTTQDMVLSAIEKLNAADAKLLGCVLNDYNYPSLKSELLRELQRLKPAFSRVATWLEEKINKTGLFSLEV